MVSGSRTWTDADAIKSAFRSVQEGDHTPPLILVSGRCPKGADKLAELAVKELGGWEIEPHPALWKVHGRAAGFVRNNEMMDSRPDRVLIFWDGVSRGTKHVIDGCKARNLPYVIFKEVP